MASIDVDKVRQLAESAERRAQEYHIKYQGEYLDVQRRAGYLNDSLYWTGYKNAYRGIIAMIEMNEIVEAEMDETPSCP